MKRMYCTPVAKVYEYRVSGMMAISLTVSDEEVSAENSLTSRFNREGRFHRGDDAATELKEWLEE